jgi:hypothetical protein
MKLTKGFVLECRKVNVLRDFLCQAMDQVDQLEEAQRWRKFSEEKPEHHQRILVCSLDYKTELRRWDEGCKFDVEVQEIYTHWMPLPKEPEDF